jgi:hypothetical protein
MKQMKTLKVNDVVYEIVDASSRARLDKLDTVIELPENDENVLLAVGTVEADNTRTKAFSIGENGSSTTGKFAHAFAVGATASGGSASGHTLPVNAESITEEAWDNGEKFTAALGKYSHAEGQVTLAVGIAAHAE